MSYDLKLFSVPEDVEPEAAYEQLIHREESEIVDINEWVKRPLPDSTRAIMQQLAEAVSQFAVYEQTASITMPYFPARTDELMECIRCCLHTCREERGYVAYDPQLGRVVTVNDLDQIAELYRASVVK